MRKIKMFVVESRDGFISREDGDIDWFLEGVAGKRADYGLRNFFGSIDTVLMNRNHYLLLLSYDLCYAILSKHTVIITEAEFPIPGHKNISFIKSGACNTRFLIRRIRELKNGTGGDIWLAGDPDLMRLLLDNSLVDEIVLTMVPVSIGSGKKLFGDTSYLLQWEVSGARKYGNGITQLIYRNYGTYLVNLTC